MIEIKAKLLNVKTEKKIKYYFSFFEIQNSHISVFFSNIAIKKPNLFDI